MSYHEVPEEHEEIGGNDQSAPSTDSGIDFFIFLFNSVCFYYRSGDFITKSFMPFMAFMVNLK
jgi:hypothetical protein